MPTLRAAPDRELLLAHRVEALPVDDDLAGGRPVDAGDQVEDRRLAAAGRADDRDDLALVDRRGRSRAAPGTRACPCGRPSRPRSAGSAVPASVCDVPLARRASTPLETSLSAVRHHVRRRSTDTIPPRAWLHIRNRSDPPASNYRPLTMRTYVRVEEQRLDPARRPRRVLRVRRAAGRPAPARPPGDRRDGGRARGELRGEGVRRAHRDGRGGRRAGSARTRSSSRRGCRPTRRRARRSSGSSRTRRRSSRGSRSTRRSSTSAGWSGASARRSRSPRACGEQVRERVGLPITVGVARTKFLAKVASARREAGRAARRAARRGARLPPPAPGRAALGRRPGHGRQAPRRGASRRSASSRCSPRRRSCRCSAGRRAGTCTRSPTTSTRGRCSGGAGAARSARSAHRAARRGRTRRSTPTSSRSSTASRGGCVRRGASAARSCSGCASTTSRARPARTRCRGPTASTADDPRRRAGAARGGAARDRAPGPDARRHLGRQPRGRARGPARAAVRPRRPRGARRRPRRGARPLRLDGDHAWRAARPRPRDHDAAAAGLSVVAAG